MNYFELYELEEGFVFDPKEIKKKYLELSRKFHPDFNSNEGEEQQEKMLELSTLNTNAYNTFRNKEKTIKYVLNLHQVLEEKPQLPPDFLMEMMEINEQLMELEFDFDKNTFDKISVVVENTSSELESNIQEDLEKYPSYDLEAKNISIERIKDYYLKNKYLLRIKETLNKFATRS